MIGNGCKLFLFLFRSGMLCAWLTGGLVACTDGSVAERENTDRRGIHATAATRALDLSEGENDLTLDLREPGDVYITSFSAKFQDVGSFVHAVYFYQPDDDGEAIRIALNASDGSGDTDPASSFGGVQLISRPGEPDETTQTLSDANGGLLYTIQDSRRGWYALKFTYSSGGEGRTVNYEAVDIDGNPLKTAWVAPPGESVDVTAAIRLDAATNVFFKGGTFGNATPSHYAMSDNVTVDGALLYRSGFDQGGFTYPIGNLSAGTHTLGFELRFGRGARSNAWFGVSDIGFDPDEDASNDVKTEFDTVQFLYQGPMHTADYDAWNGGVAFAQGEALAVGVRPPPVRRGTDAIVVCDDALLGSQDAVLKIFPLNSDVALFNSAAPADAVLFAKIHDYAGGIVSAGGGLIPHHREHWRITIPEDAPVGRYVLKAFTRDNTQIGADVLFYVLHNPYTALDTGALSKAELETYGYDEDEDGLIWNLASGAVDSDIDHQRDNFTMIVQTPGRDENNQPVLLDAHSAKVTYTSAFRRADDRHFDYALLDYAMASADGTTTPFETMLRLFRFMNHRKRYVNGNPTLENAAESLGASGWDDPDEMLALVEKCSQPSHDSPSGFVKGSAVCYNYARLLASLARSVGVVARAVNAGSHAVTEAFMPTLPIHGGHVLSDPASPQADADHWYVFDATDHPSHPESNGVLSEEALQRLPGHPFTFTTRWESVAPRGQYCMAGKVLGPFNPDVALCVWVTTTVGWELTPNGMEYSLDGSMVDILAPQYNAYNDFWITETGAEGWLGFGEKDIYRIRKETVDADYIRVRVLPSSGSSNLVPKICFVPAPLKEGVTNMSHRCSDAAAVRRIPEGDTYVVVFNDSNNLARYHGDVVQYQVEIGDGAGWATCDDNLLNGEERAVDCGGNCAGCGAGAPCEIAVDCFSYACDPISHTCLAATCDDELINGDEVNVDCGGSCPGCLEGQPCIYDIDCQSNRCGSGGSCEARPDCGDGACGVSEDCSSCPADCGACPGGCTCPSGCEAVVAENTPFAKDGADNTCYFLSGSAGSYINSWNTEAVNLNGVDITNTWIGSGNYPAAVDGGYYLYVNSGFSWSHVEVN